MPGGPGLRAPQNKPATPPAPPRKASTAVVPTPDERGARLQRRTEGLVGVAQIGAFLCTIRGQYADVGAISQYGESAAEEIAQVGEEVELIGRGLDALAAAGPYTKLLTVALPFALQLAANHGKIDYRLAQTLGVVDPVILAERAKAEIRRLAQEQALEEEAAALRRAAAEAESDRIQRERMYSNAAANGAAAHAG